jgi:hypothetical protein
MGGSSRLIDLMHILVISLATGLVGLSIMHGSRVKADSHEGLMPLDLTIYCNVSYLN